jgi:hypothetical protein
VKLYEIADRYLDVMDLLIQNEGELYPELEAALDCLDTDIKEKAGAYAKIIRTLETQAAVATGQAAGILVEVNRLKKLAQVRQKAADNLANWLKLNLERMGVTKVESDVAIVRVQKNGGRLPVVFEGDASLLPEEFRKTFYEPNKEAALAAYKARRPLPPGFTVKTQCTHLVIQ